MARSAAWCLALSLLAAGAGVAAANQAGATAAVVRRHGRSAATQPAGQTSSHIVLPSATLASGASERGTFVISNETSHPIIWRCAYLEVQLTNEQHPLYRHPTPCGPDRTLRIGTTRLRFTLRASRPVGKTVQPLPPGKYHTQLLNGLPVARPGPRAVQVVATAPATAG